MEVATQAYKQYLASGGIRRKAWYFVRKTLVKLLSDPTCTLLIHDKLLKLPLSHPLPDYLQQFQYYDRLPVRISEYIRHKYGHLNCIDVGANIGDTIASFYMSDTDTFLAIEPNSKFNKLLVDNWGWNKNVTVVSDICSSDSAEGTFSIKEMNGTASILLTENGIKRIKRPLDEIVNDYPFAMSSNVIKIDTDGHDLEVIAGAKNLISRNLPVILFECEPISTNYIKECLKTLNFFKETGYTFFLLYNSYGHLLGKYSLSDLSLFGYQLLFQLTHDSYDFDILLMKDEDIGFFYKTEIDYFEDTLNNNLPSTETKTK